MSEDGPTRRDTGAYFFLALMVLIGSSTATAAKFAVRELPVGLLPLVRFGGAGLALLPFVWGRGTLIRLLREDGPRLLAAAALCVPVNQTFFLHGTRLAPTTHVGLIYALCPLVVLGLAIRLGQERPVKGRLVGVVASVLGAGVIAVGNLLRPGGLRPDGLAGDLLLVGAVGSWGAYLTVNKPLVAKHGAIAVLAATFLAGALLYAPVAAASAADWSPRLATASATAWWSLTYLTLIVSVFGLACQNHALRRLDASHVATVGNLSPVLTVLWGIWLLREPLTPALLAGGALTLGGILWAGRHRAGPGLAPHGHHPTGDEGTGRAHAHAA